MRRVPSLSLPPYAYMPGQNPHPFKDPKGHQYGADWNFPFNEIWRLDQGWLLGLDLFDHGFFWESHEVWEAQWKTLPRESENRILLQGMIQAAASLLKPIGSVPSQRLWTASEARLQRVLHHDRGIDIAQTIASIAKALRGGPPPRVVGGWP